MTKNWVYVSVAILLGACQGSSDAKENGAVSQSAAGENLAGENIVSPEEALRSIDKTIILTKQSFVDMGENVEDSVPEEAYPLVYRTVQAAGNCFDADKRECAMVEPLFDLLVKKYNVCRGRIDDPARRLETYHICDSKSIENNP